MKKASIIAIIAIATTIASCGNSSNTNETTSNVDSTQVHADSTAIKADSAAAKDSTATDSSTKTK